MIKRAVLFVALILPLQGCYKDILTDGDSVDTFEVFWHTLNDRYVYFEEKNINWDSVYYAYRPLINNTTSEKDLKLTFKKILTQIHDGHIAVQTCDTGYIISDSLNFNKYRSPFRYNHLRYYSEYFISPYSLTEPVYCQQFQKQITYLYCTSFMGNPSLDSIKRLISTNIYTNGFIIDVRGNRGGLYNNLSDLLSLFCPPDFLVGYEKIKTGPGRNSFSDFDKIIVNGSDLIPAHINKVILMDNGVYSAGNIFCAFMREVPNTIIIGTKSSGGGGSPSSVMLPNNWVLTFPRNKWFDLEYRSLEEGVNPDILEYYPENRDSINKGYHPDPIIEKALEYLNSH